MGQTSSAERIAKIFNKFRKSKCSAGDFAYFRKCIQKNWKVLYYPSTQNLKDKNLNLSLIHYRRKIYLCYYDCQWIDWYGQVDYQPLMKMRIYSSLDDSCQDIVLSVEKFVEIEIFPTSS